MTGRMATVKHMVTHRPHLSYFLDHLIVTRYLERTFGKKKRATREREKNRGDMDG